MRVLMILASVAFPALACECSHLTFCELIRQPTIFIGEVIDGGVASIREDPWHSSSTHVRFKVLENFRGLRSGTKTVDIQVPPTAGMCAPNPYYPGRKYLVVPGIRDGNYVDYICFQGRDLEAAAEDVRQVREYFAGTMPVNVHGRIAATDSEFVDYLLNVGEAKPLANVTVSTTYGARLFSTQSDANGRYRLGLPAAGNYVLRATLKPYASEPAAVSVPAGGCTSQDFGLSVGNTISGSVWDETRQPVQRAEVGLIDLDRRSSSLDRHAWFAHAYAEPDGTFRLKNVPIGRYLLIFNPDGPRSGGRFDLPFESTYYPSGARFANARTVDVKSGAVHLTGMNLVVGRRVEFRSVVVKVRFPDGVPMKTALVRCIALPDQEGDVPWVQGVVTGTEAGTARFSAPSNRKLRLKVGDWYGRDLHGIYTSVHDAGLTDIKQDFVIKP